jgi:arylsulfatase A-like enzyme
MLQHTNKVITKPNVLFIITDQQRHDAVGYINPQVITPNLDALAKQSIVFTNAFVQSPQCQPSRASIWTGRYPTAHKVWWNETNLPLTERTIANVLRDDGYETAYFGKFHVENDDSASAVSKHFGFNTSYLMEDWSVFIRQPNAISGDYYPDKTEAAKYRQKYATVREEFYGTMSNRNWTGSFSNKSLHHEEVITDNAIDHITKSKNPYFVVVSYHGPHPPYAAPAEFSSLYDKSKMRVPSVRIPNTTGHVMDDEEWRETKVQYYGAVSWIDDNIGRLIKAAPDAIIVFMSDHGDMLGEHGHFSKGIYAYDGNTRIPLLMRLPHKCNATYPHLVQAIDIFPTLCKLTNNYIPANVQGQDLTSHIVASTTCNEEIVSMLCFVDRLRMIRTLNWKYWIVGDNEYLFDLNTDINEANNLAGDQRYESLLNHARFRLMKRLIKCEDPCPYPRKPN